jgi:parallel beta-helix repeat protein
MNASGRRLGGRGVKMKTDFFSGFPARSGASAAGNACSKMPAGRGSAARTARCIGLGLALLTIVGGESVLRSALPAAIGPQSPAVDPARYATVRWVDARRGDDVTGDGSRGKPWASLPHALENIGTPASGARAALLVASGRYAQPTLTLKSRVDLYGGFAPGTPSGGVRDVYAHATLLDGGELQRIAFGADDVRVDGFHFVRGRVRGKGAALFCDGVSPVIANCVFTQNRTLIPQPWDPRQLHETAHDGGAVFATNGAAPRIENCLFVDNTTECGRGAAVAADRRAAPRILASVFANNRSGIDDPMRSSDGGALSFFDGCGGEVSGCVISANAALTHNDAGGIFVALWSSPRIVDNVFTANDGGDDAGALFIGGQEHRYGVPLDAYPPADKFNVPVERNVFAGNTNSARNSGAMRVTMESRATLTDNIIAENRGGIYLQRSEIVAERNTVWQDWRFIEDKASLGPSRLAGNILRGPLGSPINVRATLIRNMAEAAAGGTDRLEVADVFEPDGITGKIKGVRYDAAAFSTVVTVEEPLPGGSLSGRPVGFGRGGDAHWRVIRHAAGRELIVWGRLEPQTVAATEFTVLRTFTLRRDAPAGIGARLNLKTQ